MQYAHKEFDPARASNIAAEPETLTAAGALAVDKRDSVISINDAANVAFTLADAAHQGAQKVIVLAVKGGMGNAVLTPANLAGGTTITFDAVGDSVLLEFLAGEWFVVANNGATVA